MRYSLGTLNDIKDIMHLIDDVKSNMLQHNIFQWDELYPIQIDFEEDIKKENLYIVYNDKVLVAIYVISKEYDEAYLKCSWNNPDDKAYILHRFCVSPQFQHQGIGKEVLLHLEQQILKMGYRSVRLDVYSKNPYALRLYQNNGYVQRGYADWRKGRFYLMEKNLEENEHDL